MAKRGGMLSRWFGPRRSAIKQARAERKVAKRIKPKAKGKAK